MEVEVMEKMEIENQRLAFGWARQAFAKQDWQRAAHAYKTLSQQNPEDGLLRECLAICLYKLKQEVQAQQAYEQALQIYQSQGLLAKVGNLRRHFEMHSAVAAGG